MKTKVAVLITILFTICTLAHADTGKEIVMVNESVDEAIVTVMDLDGVIYYQFKLAGRFSLEICPEECRFKFVIVPDQIYKICVEFRGYEAMCEEYSIPASAFGKTVEGHKLVPYITLNNPKGVR